MLPSSLPVSILHHLFLSLMLLAGMILCAGRPSHVPSFYKASSTHYLFQSPEFL